MKKLTRSLLLLTLLAFGQGVWAQTHVSNESALRTAVQANGANIVLDKNITLTDMLTIDAGKTVTINLNSHTLDRGLKDASEGISRGQVFAIAGTLNLNGGTITGAFGTYGGSYVASGATFNLNGVSIRDCKSKNGGGAIYNDGTVNITGGSIESCVDIKITMGSNASATGYGGAIYNNGTLTISDCNINTCLAIDKGGAIYNTSGVGHNVTISDCTIKSCNSSEGGAICNEGVMTINSGTFGGDSSDDANASGDGGAIYNASNAYLTINGGTFMNNKSTKYGGGAITNQGTLYVYGGSITNNTSVGNGGGIYTNGPIYMHGDPVIEDNTKVNGGTNNLYLADMATPAFTRPILVDGAFTSGARIGFTAYDPADKVTEGYSTYNGSTDPATYLFADNGMNIGLKNGEVYQGDMLLVYEESDLPTNNVITSNLYIRLMANVTITREIVFGDDTHNVLAILDLNGYTLDRNLSVSATYGNVIKVVSGSTLTINDNSANGTGVITGGYTDNSGGIRNEGTLYFNGGTVKDNHAISQGAGIWNKGGTAYINGGVIKDNYCTNENANGGGIYNQGTLEIMGGTITGNHAGSSGKGDGIYFASGTFYMGGNPRIYNNYNNGSGPDIYLPDGKQIIATGRTFTEGAYIGVNSQYVGENYPIIANYSYNNSTTDPATIFYTHSDSYYPKMVSNNVYLMPGQVFTVTYLDENGVTQTQMGCHDLDYNITDLYTGWYVIYNYGESWVDRYYNSRIAIHGVVNIILVDRTRLKAKKGFSVIPNLAYPETSLNIYAQSTGDIKGQLYTTDSFSVDDYCAGIGGDYQTDCGPITINGGFLSVKGGKSAAGIGSGYNGVINDITINGGRIQVYGGDNTESSYEGASAIGGGESSNYGAAYTINTITINGGTIIATGGAIANDEKAPGIGYRRNNGSYYANVVLNYANSSNISINSKSGYAGNVTLFNVFKDQSNNIYGRGLVQDNSTLAGDKTLTAFTSGPVFDTDGDWNIADNWHTGVVPTSGNVYVVAAANIPDGYTAEAGNINLNNGGTLTIADGGQLVCSNNPYVTMTKHIDAADWEDGTSGWNFIATPTNALTIDNTAQTNLIGGAEYDLYRFNQSAASAWENYKAVDGNNEPLHPDFTTLENGKGYLYARNTSIDVLFMGNLANSNETVDLAFDPNVTGIEQGFNLVGNPFACNATVNRECYVIDGGFVKPTTETTIAPCTGVMVKATAENQTVTFTKTPETPAMTHAGNNIQITLAQTIANRGSSNTATIDNAIVSFNEGHELDKFYFGTQNANIYIPQNNKEYAIVSSNTQGEMPLNFKANETGSYTLTVNPENVEMSYLHLIDNLTGADINLLATPSYTFNAKSDDYASRFRLVFSTNSVSETIENESFAFISNGEIIINGIGTLQVIDMLGRIIVSQDTERQISTNEMNPGVYVLRLIDGEKVKTQKIVIK